VKDTTELELWSLINHKSCLSV